MTSAALPDGGSVKPFPSLRIIPDCCVKPTGAGRECSHRRRYIISYHRKRGVGLLVVVGVGRRRYGEVVGYFWPKNRAASADQLTPRLRNGNGNGGDHISIESLSDVGSRMGEENQVLRNLLTDTGRKISELDDLKQAFDKLVTPLNSTLRAVEQEKS